MTPKAAASDAGESLWISSTSAGGDYVSHCEAAVQRYAGKQRCCRRRDQGVDEDDPPSERVNTVIWTIPSEAAEARAGKTGGGGGWVAERMTTARRRG